MPSADFRHDGLTVSIAFLCFLLLFNMLISCALSGNRQNRQTVILLFDIFRAPV